MEMRESRAPLAPFALSFGIIALDQISKALVAARVEQGTVAFSALGDFFWIVRQSNLGMAFSLLDRLPPGPRAAILVALPLVLVAAVVIFYFRSREPTALQRWALCGIVGGGLGNVIDRVLRADGVVDFISVRCYGLFGYSRWPTFNVADASVVVSALILIVSTIVIDARRRG